MIKVMNQAEKQLKDACLITGARWALWMERENDDWNFGPQYGLSQARSKTLRSYLGDRKVIPWLAGALSSGRPRWHKLIGPKQALNTARLYVFPNTITHQMLLIGADQLDRTADGLFRLLAKYSAPQTSSDAHLLESTAETPVWPFEATLEASYDPQHALASLLEYLASRLPCEAAYLAIRSGDIFHIQATWHCEASVQNTDIQVNTDTPLQTIIETGQGLILEDVAEVGSFAVRKIMRKGTRAWLGIPVMIGRRMIGLVAFASSQPNIYTDTHLHQATQRVNQVAYNVENAIILSEVTRYLQQLAVLNELASTAALGFEAGAEHPGDELARRVMIRLRRVFNTDWAAVLLLSPDGQTLQEFGGGSLNAPPWIVPVNNSLMGLAVEKGSPIRLGDLGTIKRYFPIRPNLRSELAVPLKYRGKVIGALVLVSEEPNAFSSQDEQLLVVIASQMAGLFENARLNEETRERAQKLADSVRQLQAVRDTSLDLAGDLDLNTLLKRVTRRARDLVDAKGVELGLYNEQEQVVEIVVAETPWENIQGIRIPLMEGVAGRMAAFGLPIVVDDYNSWDGRLLPERQANFKTVAGVPLKFKGQVIGTLTVLDDRPDKSFSSEDVQLLELLAPQAAISIRNARLYQELEERIQAQQLAESRLIRSARLAAVGEMAAGVAHELNNPLTTVTGFVELALYELPKDSPQREDLELVLQEAHRARGVVRRLLDFSRPVEDQRTRADINELINQVLPLFNHLARTSGITLTTQLDDHLPWLPIDPNQIKQVLINLIHNAILAMPHGGLLSMRTSREEQPLSSRPTSQQFVDNQNYKEWIMVSVTDTGEGIPPEILERIFEPFFSTRPEGKGTGLGLSVSWGIITSHSGFIEVDSKAGEGSCFRIYLPIKD